MSKQKLVNGWIYLSDQLPPKQKSVLVTNNPESKNAHGDMSHVWLCSSVHKDGKRHCAFSSDRKIENLVAWHPLPGHPYAMSSLEKCGGAIWMSERLATLIDEKTHLKLMFKYDLSEKIMQLSRSELLDTLLTNYINVDDICDQEFLVIMEALDELCQGPPQEESDKIRELKRRIHGEEE